MKKDYREEDDNRVVADMTGIERKNPFAIGRPKGIRAELTPFHEEVKSPYGEDEVTGEQRKWYILGTLKAALAIGAVYAVGFGILILLLILFWNH